MFKDNSLYQIKKHVVSALRCAKNVVSILSHYAEQDDSLRVESGASAYALMGLQSIKAAEVLYQLSCEEDDILESVFQKYDVFCSEVVDSLAEHESPQWVFTYYGELIDSVEPLQLVLPESFFK